MFIYKQKRKPGRRSTFHHLLHISTNPNTISGEQSLLPLLSAPLAPVVRTSSGMVIWAVAWIWHSSQPWLNGVFLKSTPSVQILKAQLSHARNCPISCVSVLRAQEAEKVGSHGPAVPAFGAIQAPVLPQPKPQTAHGWTFQGLSTVCCGQRAPSKGTGASGRGVGGRCKTMWKRRCTYVHVHGQERTTQRTSQTASIPGLLSPLCCTSLLQRSIARWKVGAWGQNQKRKNSICSHRPWLKMVIYFVFIFTLTVSLSTEVSHCCSCCTIILLVSSCQLLSEDYLQHSPPFFQI